MAFQQDIQLPVDDAPSGNYIALRFHVIDPIAREASAHFHLYASAARAAANPRATKGLIAKLRLVDAKFDQYLGKEALAAAGGDARKQLYLAARAELLIPGGGLSELDLSDAVDV